MIMTYLAIVIALLHFCLIFRLELIVKKLTLKMLNPDKSNVARKQRLKLFLFIISIVLLPFLISTKKLFMPEIDLSVIWLSTTISSGVFGCYFCICKLFSFRHVHHNWVITVPSHNMIQKILSALGVILIIGMAILLLYLETSSKPPEHSKFISTTYIHRT